MSSSKSGMFIGNDGRNLLFTFILVSSLFLLWGFCNGMIDVMDKHFQKDLQLSLAQSAWVQFAHYLGYFLMAIPAGWLASRMGYKGGIIAGLLMVAVGGFWFIPATKIATFPAFLLGVCIIASGLTFLETVANPYTTVLGPKQFAATRINLAQSCNGVGWIFGPIAGAMFFYGKDQSGQSTGAETLWIPYAAVGAVVLLLSVIFFFTKLPDLQSQDEFHLDDQSKEVAYAPIAHKGVAFSLLWLNIAVLAVAIGMIFASIVAIPSIGAKLGMTDNQALLYAASILLVIGSVVFIANKKRVTNHSIWSHPHFSAATLAQFLYVAAQCGIFAYFINYMTTQVPSIPASWKTGRATEWIEVQTTVFPKDVVGISDLAAKLNQKADPVSAYLHGKLSPGTLKALDQYLKDSSAQDALAATLTRDLTHVVREDSSSAAKEELFYSSERFAGVALSEKTQALLRDKEAKKNYSHDQLNRHLLHDAYPRSIAFDDASLTLSDQFASLLASLGFFCFLAGRVIGAMLLKKFPAHKVLTTFCVLAGACCLLIFMRLGWISAIALFLTYFFMSIMFPTIFALGIHGLGARAKKASSFIVMAIMGGAIMPKLMGHIGDAHGMSIAFIVPLVCFVGVGAYAFFWSKLSAFDGKVGVKTSSGH